MGYVIACNKKISILRKAKIKNLFPDKTEKFPDIPTKFPDIP